MAQTLYVVAYLASATDPADDATGHAQIKNGQDGSGTSAAWASSTAWTGSGTYLDPTGLSAGTLYATAAVVYDDVALTYSNRVLATETRTQYLLTAAAGSFTLTGVAAALTHNRYLAAATGAFTLTGVAAALTHNRYLAASTGAFTFTGNDATLTYTPSGAYSMTAETGSFALTGNAASLTATHNPLTAEAGSFALTGNAASFVYSRALVAETGTFTLTGLDAALSTTGTVEAPTAKTGAGKPSRQRRRRVVTIDGEDRIVQSDEEAIALLEDARDRAQKQADLAIERASKATRRPVRKVLADARKTLEMPAIAAGPGLEHDVSRILGDIRSIYQSAMNSVEIAARLASIQAAEEDDEEILMLIA